MKTHETKELSLAQIEAEVMAEGREWTRKRMEERIRPAQPTRREAMGVTSWPG
jgi:hypothetical protein